MPVPFSYTIFPVSFFPTLYPAASHSTSYILYHGSPVFLQNSLVNTYISLLYKYANKYTSISESNRLSPLVLDQLSNLCAGPIRFDGLFFSDGQSRHHTLFRRLVKSHRLHKHPSSHVSRVISKRPPMGGYSVELPGEGGGG